MNTKYIALALIILIIPLAGCTAPPILQGDSDSKIPENRLELKVYVDDTHQYYSGYISPNNNGWTGPIYGQQATEDYFWVDIRNTGRQTQTELNCYISNAPDDWTIYEIDAVPEPWTSNLKVTFNKYTKEINILYAQHDKDSSEYHTEQETTIMLRFRVSTGLRGGFDYDGDGFPDSVYPNDPSYSTEGRKVGYFTGDYYLYFKVLSSEGAQADAKLSIDINDEGLHPVNDIKPHNYREVEP